jgi:hypothetical protein
MRVENVKGAVWTVDELEYHRRRPQRSTPRLVFSHIYPSVGRASDFHCTAKTQYRKFKTNIPRKGIARLSPNFHIHVSVSDLYNPTIGLHILLPTGKYVDRSLGIYKSLTDTD